MASETPFAPMELMVWFDNGINWGNKVTEYMVFIKL